MSEQPRNILVETLSPNTCAPCYITHRNYKITFGIVARSLRGRGVAANVSQEGSCKEVAHPSYQARSAAHLARQ